MKHNCWEYNKCGRGLGGHKAHELGVCPAAKEIRLNSIHGGLNAGRACWVIAGTMCQGQVQGTFARKQENCYACEFYKKVREEEGGKFQFSINLLKMINQGSTFGLFP